MEGRLNIVMGIFLVILVVATGRNLLLKKTGKKSVKAETTTSVAKTSETVAEAKLEEKKSDDTAPVTQTEEKVIEEKVETKVIAKPVKLSTPELEKLAQDGLCSSGNERDFCSKMKDTVPAFKGARLKDDQMYIFVDNSQYIQKAQALSAPAPAEVDPAATAQVDSMGAPPAAYSGNTSSSLNPEKKNEIASALLLRDLMANVKQEIRNKNLTLILQRDSMSPMSPPTFALNCSGNSLANQSSDVFSDENLKAGNVDYSSFCQLN